MPQVTIPTINWGKRKQRSQMCEIFTDDGRIVNVELDVLKSCVDDPDKGIGFLLDSDDQFIEEDKQWHQILYEKSSLPICMISGLDIKEGELGKTLDQIFHESQEEAKLRQYERAAKNTIMDKLVWIISIICSAAVIMFAINHFGG